MNYRMWLLALFGLLLVPLAACSGVSATVNFRADDQYNYLTISMTEEETQTLFTGLFTESSDLRISNPVVELRSGEIAISGDVPSGSSGTVQANLIVQVAGTPGQPSLRVTSLSFAGWEGTPDMLEGINSELAAGFAAAAQNAEDGQVTDISITETALSFTVRSPREA